MSFTEKQSINQVINSMINDYCHVNSGQHKTRKKNEL